jgi:hypothetical protein
MNTITPGQIVLSNTNYYTCAGGIFEDYDFVLCYSKGSECNVMFLAIMVIKNINELNNESSN